MKLSRALALLALIAIIIAILPIIATTTALLVADTAECNLNAAGPKSCVILGMEIKDILYGMAMSHWLLLFTIFYAPIAVALAIAAFVVMRRNRKANATVVLVGLRFWLGSLGLLVLPLFTDVGLVLLALAAIHWAVLRYREHKMQPKSGDGR